MKVGRAVLSAPDRAREMMKHVHPAYDCATVDFDRIAIGTGILCVECKACGKRAALTGRTARTSIPATGPRCAR